MPKSSLHKDFNKDYPMPLVPCRACSHEVDTSALACPQCGATDPANKLSRQQRNVRIFFIQLVLWLALIGISGWYIWHDLIPAVRQYISKSQIEAPAANRP